MKERKEVRRWTSKENCAPPEDIKGVEIHIVEDEDGDGCSTTVKGDGMTCMMVLEDALAEAVASVVTGMPKFMSELTVKYVLKNLEEDIRSAVKVWEEKNNE